MIKLIRFTLGQLILLADYCFPPKKVVQRSKAEKHLIDEKTKSLSLYQFKACPFCVKVRRAARKLDLNLETKDVLKNETLRQELLSNGGKVKVPCLRITNDNKDVWMYESSKIVDYLNSTFA
ncbi:MAG: glutathione S-transferase N-terminal domain-containing protein [Bdellovibrionales bacterium]|nr:glutathione S-transferase N-terminal domain-containing protein [Bdellovibrionales bacterium]